MAEIGDIKPAQPVWQKRPADRVGPDSRQPRPPARERPRPEDDKGEEDPRGGKIDEYA